MDLSLWLGQIGHLLIASAIGFFLFLAIRGVSRRSHVTGVILGLGVLLRAALGLALFWISYLNLPILRSMQMGGGFWSLMGDAKGYYGYAAVAVERGLSTIEAGQSSPLFMRTLAVWMRVVGVSPVAGLFLNLCLLVGFCYALTRALRPVNDWRRDLPLLATVGSISFSPVLLIHATQALKEDLFLVLIAAVCFGVLLLLQPFMAGTLTRWRSGAIGAFVLVPATYFISGIRAYYGVIVCACLAAVFVGLVLFTVRRRLLGYSVAVAAVLALMWAAYTAGSGPNFRPTPEELNRVKSTLHVKTGADPSATITAVGTTAKSTVETAASWVDSARTGFQLAGGATNIVPHAGPDVNRRSNPQTRTKLVALGLGVVFVPISILKAWSIIDFAGGHGLLPIADADTIFQDVTLLLICALLWVRRREIGTRLPLVLFCLTLSGVTALLLGYVVTNFGTLFRIKYLVAVPVWVLSLAIAPNRKKPRVGSENG